MSQLNNKKKVAEPDVKVCAFCLATDAHLVCAKCKDARYCSKACQKQHWMNGHRELCFTPEERRPRTVPSASVKGDQGPAAAADAGCKSSECPICWESFSGRTLCTLPCDHEFHKECVEELRKHGVQQACPLCRVDLPGGPEKLCEDATRMFVKMSTRHQRSMAGPWKPQTVSKKKIMVQIVNMWTNAANQGHIRAQYNLGFNYSRGWGVAQDYKTAMRWFRKAADQGMADAQFCVGSMYQGDDWHSGQGVDEDYKTAMRWFRKAAEQCMPGDDWHSGQGVDEDFNESVRWFRKSADQGEAGAQQFMAELLYMGDTIAGIPQDLELALFYVSAAEAQGIEGTRELREDIEAALSK
eukprot:CAMPEP_0171989828 /NCGR_PEP_ID=MMETSP0993-20121228/276611_1 /TAXON_ID=483369 /ORGANISM="non described non described, Strain CCMP2098" /LENGTH=354 /DNA_ID=CAMNT_0012642825 /DNA_START=111 /DNA_END=1175 /DNA_ORIENTATION=+